MPKDADLHLPSDLIGLSTATFVMPEDRKRLVAALGPACNKVRHAIKEASPAQASALFPNDASDLALALSLAVPEPEQKHLANLAAGRTKGYQSNGYVRSELRHLVSMGLLEKLPGRHVGDMKSGGIYDLAEFVTLTENGRQWVAKTAAPRSQRQAAPSP
jgi:hypothetical protein